ncbi:phosphonate C-P lyase system protein PhnL [Puia dinghuensis]|uniref:ABC transporter n=1 Tax=Puia dinghuensis TaxID=1792502 RepID=A0A8J2XTW9_9BACT|nr:ATP-binding cassette domain-containing protein [Puia dinghuensis]GGB07302.1 ABC transporter [Puia dinghuensis]
MNIIEVHQLSKTFDLHILHDKQITALQHIDMTIREGEIIGLTGRSGSGKSSLMKCLYRTYLATTGEIRYASASGVIDLVKADDHAIIALRRQEMRYCSQFLSVIPRVPAVDVVAEPLLRTEKNKEEARARARTLLEMLGLPSGLWDAYPVTFSGGEQQRVNVARAIIAKPRLLLIDEPTASLDVRTKDVVIGLIRDLKQHGTSVLCISHDEYTLSTLADRRLHLQAGRITPTVTEII